jgi:UDP-glucuronate decarboxylase
VEGLIRLMNTPELHQPVNLGNPDEYTIMELAQKTLGLIKTPAAMVYRPLPADDPGRRRPDITRAKDLLGWQPTVPLETGLKETIPYFAKRLKEERQPVAGTLTF